MHRKNQPEHEANTMNLPEEVLLHVFSFLGPVHRAKKAVPVCQTWKRLATDTAFKVEDEDYKADYLAEKQAVQDNYSHVQKSLFDAMKNPQSRAELLAKISHLLTHEGRKWVNIAIIGEEGLVGKINALPDSASSVAQNMQQGRFTKAGGFNISIRSIHNGDRINQLRSLSLRNVDLILFCPDDTKDFRAQISELNESLNRIAHASTLVFIINADFNAGNYFSVHLQADDSLQTLYSNILSRLVLAEEKLMVAQRSAKKDEISFKHNTSCTVS
jgi:F-box-like